MPHLFQCQFRSICTFQNVQHPVRTVAVVTSDHPPLLHLLVTFTTQVGTLNHWPAPPPMVSSIGCSLMCSHSNWIMRGKEGGGAGLDAQYTTKLCSLLGSLGAHPMKILKIRYFELESGGTFCKIHTLQI